MENFITELFGLFDLGKIDWVAVAAASIHIALVLVLIRVMVALLHTVLRRLDARLIERDRAQGALTAESTRRAGTLVKPLFQGAMVMIWVTGILVVLREYRRWLKKAFDAEGISIPFPQRTLHIAGTAGPADVFPNGRTAGSR